MKHSVRLLLATLSVLAGCAGIEIAPKRPAPSLVELCASHRTDKCPFHHDYVETYERFFGPIRNEVRKVLEIGVARGDSMRLWQAYFPNADIYGIDIRDSSKHESDRITTLVADQASRSDLGRVLDSLATNFDIIIDDGGHSMEQQQTSFGFLFPYLRSGGLYVIEDIHTSFPELYPGYDVEPDRANSTFAMVVGWFGKKRFASRYLTRGELEYLNANVAECLYWNRHNRWQSDLFLCTKK